MTFKITQNKGVFADHDDEEEEYLFRDGIRINNVYRGGVIRW